MCKKKLMTAILVTTMVMGSTLTAFAADAGGDAASKSGGTSGSGTSEGHLEKVWVVCLVILSKSDRI